MRKLFILCTAMAVTIASVGASYAASDIGSAAKAYTKATKRIEAGLFIDEDGDGICDNTGMRISRRAGATADNEAAGNAGASAYGRRLAKQNRINFVDENGDGICDNVGTRPNFVDENGDGICDNAGTQPNFVDKDGDGICDNCTGDCPLGTAPKDGTGNQNRRGGGGGKNSN